MSDKEHRYPIIPPPVHAGHGWYEWGYKMGAPQETSPRSAFWNHRSWLREQGTAPIDRYCPHGQPGDKTEDGIIVSVKAVLERGSWERVIVLRLEIG